MSPACTALISLLLVVTATFIFAKRMPLAFELPNFYAEDGNRFIDDALKNTTPSTLFTSFNGYLVIGQYLLVEIAVAIYEIFNIPFYKLPEVMAWVSCAFFGITATLPFILLRKHLGVVVTLLMYIATCLVALPSSDFAVIGTIGNLKFLFLLWAFYFILYRNFNYRDLKKTVLADVAIVFSVLTYAPAVALLPFALWPYRQSIVAGVRQRNISPIPRELIGLIVVGMVCFVYLVIVYMSGIPKLPGYLDAPYVRGATIKILYRVTFYEVLNPLTSSMRDLVTLGLVGITAYLGLLKQQTRFITLFGFWSVMIATVAFVANRPGVSYAFEDYGPNPDQFFYSQALLFTFVLIVIGVTYAKKFSASGRIVLSILVGILIWWNYPTIDSDQVNKPTYIQLGSAESNLAQECKTTNAHEVEFQIYPSELWTWKLDRNMACEGIK